MMRKAEIGITIVVICVSGVSLFLFISGRLHVQPLLICLTPIPSAATVVAAIHFGPGDGGPGVGNDGREYQGEPLECPHTLGSGTPKLTMWLRIMA